jgi:hypothetical protein
MKNIHLAPTLEPSKLYKVKDLLSFEEYQNKSVYAGNLHVYITNSESIYAHNYLLIISDSLQIGKKGDIILINSTREGHTEYTRMNGSQGWFASEVNYQKDWNYKKIVLTNDAKLIKDGVQEIDETFLHWLAENPTCEYVEVTQSFNPTETVYGFNTSPYKIIITPQKDISSIDSIDSKIQDYSMDYLSSVADGKRPTGYADEDFRAGANKMFELVPDIISEYLETAFISTEQGYLNPNEWLAKRINKNA